MGEQIGVPARVLVARRQIVAGPGGAGQLLQQKETIGTKITREGARRGELIDFNRLPFGRKIGSIFHWKVNAESGL